MADSDPVVLDHDAMQVIEEGPSLPALLTEDFVAQFERGITQYKRWVTACYRLTRETHWINHGRPDGQPRFFLQGPGAEALMNPLGISFERPTLTRIDLANGDYAYRCEGYLESKTLGRRGYYEGYCDSLDPFFTARPGWNKKTGEGDIRKSSTTNWIVNGVSRMGGIRDPDPETLRAAGLDPARIPTVDYKSRRHPEDDAGTISDAQAKRLWAICKSNNVSEEALRARLAKDGWKSTREVTRGKYEAVCAWAQAGGQTPPNGGERVRDPGEEG